MRDLFARFASKSAAAIGSGWTFTIYCLLVVVWLASGPLFNWNDSFQLIGNTVTSLATTAIALLIQNTVNRDTRALHLKLDELIRAQDEARTGLVDLESLSQDEQERLAEQFSRLRERHQQEKGHADG